MKSSKTLKKATRRVASSRQEPGTEFNTQCVLNYDILLYNNSTTFVTRCVTNLRFVGSAPRTASPIVGYRPTRAGCPPILVPAHRLPVGRIPQQGGHR
jgi:hypothetical protein